MGESRRRRRATRSEKRGASLRRRFGSAPLELCLFPLTGVEPPRSSAEERVAAWFFQASLQVLARKERGELDCVCCDAPKRRDGPRQSARSDTASRRKSASTLKPPDARLRRTRSRSRSRALPLMRQDHPSRKGASNHRNRRAAGQGSRRSLRKMRRPRGA
jgi:hypothetical protein